MLDGSRLVGTALAAGVAIERVIFAGAYYSDAGRIAELLDALARAGVELVGVTPREFSRISYKADGVVAIATHPPRLLDDADLPDDDVYRVVVDQVGSVRRLVHVVTGAIGVELDPNQAL